MKIQYENALPCTEEIVCCDGEKIIAYLDGELSSAASAVFEEHLKTCAKCDGTLREHKKLLCVLQSAHDSDSFAMPLPVNFAEIVTARAETYMGGVRGQREFKLALWICAPLALLCAALLGTGGCVNALKFAVMVVKHAASFVVFMARSLFDVGAGLYVILRAVGRNLFNESRPVSLLAMLFLLVVALWLLSRLIAVYHRQAQGITE